MGTSTFFSGRFASSDEAYRYLYSRALNCIRTYYPAGTVTLKLDSSYASSTSLHYDTFDCINGISKGPASYTGNAPYFIWAGYIISNVEPDVWEYASGGDGYRLYERYCKYCNNHY